MDPIVGCPADCFYCYLGPLGLRPARPVVRAGPEALAEELRRYLAGRRSLVLEPEHDRTPICIGNYTDMIISPANREALVDYLRAITRVLNRERPLIVVTKGTVPVDIVTKLDEFGWPVYWFFSQSMSAEVGIEVERGPVAELSTTLANARLVSSSRHQHAVHFWRPFVPELRPGPEHLLTIVRTLCSSGLVASVVIGLKRGKGVPIDDVRLRSVMSGSVGRDGETSEIFDEQAWPVLVSLARNEGYRVYRRTSCALATLGLGQEPWRVPRSRGSSRHCRGCVCSPRPERVADHRGDDERLVGRVAEFLNLPAAAVAFDRHTQTLAIAEIIDEYDFNVLFHALATRWYIRPLGVRRRKAWLGAFTEGIGQ